MPRTTLFSAVGAFSLAAFSANLAGCADPIELASLDGPYADSYAVVVSKKTYSDFGWREVTDALVRKRHATLIITEGYDVAAAKARLAAIMPRYTAFVATPDECGRPYVAALSKLVRDLDADPYDDTIWGIVTARDAEGAKRVALASRTIVAKSALGTTGVNNNLFESTYTISDGKAGDWSSKNPREGAKRGNGHEKPDARVWAEQFETMQPEFLVSSSHGFQNGFEMPFGRGYILADKGELHVIDDYKAYRASLDAAPGDKERKAITAALPTVAHSDTPRVWLPAGNCLIGHVNGKDAVIPTMLQNYGVRQVAGYTVPTWFGAAGWGALGQWQNLPSRYTLSEAVFFNHQTMLAELNELSAAATAYTPTYDNATHADQEEIERFISKAVAAGVKVDPEGFKDMKSPTTRTIGLLWDRDTFALYGDPMLAARLDFPKEDQIYSTGFDQVSSDRFRFTVKINDTGSAMTNERPVGALFSTRLRNVKLISGAEYSPVIADNFILVRKAQPVGHEKELVIEFEGEPVL
jgi:hypothetical protein